MQFLKPVLLDSETEPAFQPVCDAWSSRSLVSFPLRKDREIVGALVFGKRSSHPFTPVQVKLLWILGMQAENRLQQSESVKTPSFYSFIDPLTHLYNWGYFNHQLEKEILRSRRNGESFSLLTLDLDGFKAYNDRFLQSAGDIALQEFAGILSGSVREVDTVARLGGDEFGILLLEGNTEGAQALAQRIIQRFQRHLLPGDKETRTERLSVSIGVASFPSDSFDKADLVSKADRALHIARSKGGGRVLSFHETTNGGGVKNILLNLPVQKIYEAGRSVVDMDKFLEILLFTGMQGLSAGRGSIVVKDAEGDFTLRAAIGFSRHEEHITASGVFRAGPITNWVVDHQLPLIVSKPEDSPFGGQFKKNGYQTESFLSIPLTHHGQTLGALHLTNRKDHRAFTYEDLKTFAPITSEIAAILAQGIGFRENVRTFSLSILTSLSDALELRFPFLSGHSNRVRDLSTRIGERMGLAKADPRRPAARRGAARRGDRRHSREPPGEEAPAERSGDGDGPEAPLPRVEDAGRRAGDGRDAPGDPRAPRTFRRVGLPVRTARRRHLSACPDPLRGRILRFRRIDPSAPRSHPSRRGVAHDQERGEHPVRPRGGAAFRSSGSSPLITAPEFIAPGS